MTYLQAEEMVHDLREHVRAKSCSMSTQMKLDSYVHNIWRERMERPTIAPSLHQFFTRKKTQPKETTDTTTNDISGFLHK